MKSIKTIIFLFISAITIMSSSVEENIKREEFTNELEKKQLKKQKILKNRFLQYRY